MAEMIISQTEQETLLKAQQAYARENSRFFREAHPFTTAEDLCREPESFLCVSPKEIARVITLRSTGSTRPPKRLFFTERDLRQTEEFFFYGMQPMVRPGEIAAVFMEGASACSVGGLLQKALARFGAAARVAGFYSGEDNCAQAAQGAACLVGTPAQMALLADRCPFLRPKTVLLSGERVASSLRKRLEAVWGAETFTHWGMCETGYGGAVENAEHNGLSVRNDSLCLEVIDPQTKEALPVGQSGEIVFSTLNREGMPLLRYRTGDYGRLLPIRGALPRLDGYIERLSERKKLADGGIFSPLAVDEIAFSAEHVIDCRTHLQGDRLTVTVRGHGREIEERLRALYPALTVTVRETEKDLPFLHGKRTIGGNE